ncbi:hypothetical protein BYT27DRAFT_7021576, partial [Phlegmacium glaucopus]
DVNMEIDASPPALGASRIIGGILHGKAYGNVSNHADYPRVHPGNIPFGNAQVDYKIFAYLVYDDPVKVNVTVDPSLHPNTMFRISTVPPLESVVVLKKVANRLESVITAHVFVQSNLSGLWQWNLLGRYEHVLQDNEDLEYNENNECHVLFCLPQTPSFALGSYPPGSSYPSSTHLSEVHSCADTSVSLSGPKRTRVDEELLHKLKAAGLTINHSLCYDMNPTLQVMYQRYIHIHEIQAKISDMVSERVWPRELGKSLNQTDIIGLFVAKTTWHNSYAKLFPVAEGCEDMRAWLEGDGVKSDLEVWGVVKSKYTVGDLAEWVKGLKGKKKPAVKKSMKGKEKEKEK